MLQIIFQPINKQQKIQLLVNHILKVLKKNNKSFHSCFILKLPSNGIISEKEFIRLLRKFLAKIQCKQLYISVFEVDAITDKLYVTILISSVYSKTQITMLCDLWNKFLLRESGLLTKSHLDSCFHYTPFSTTVDALNFLFRLEKSKDQIPFRLGTHDIGKKKMKCNKYSIYPGVFYGSGEFSVILQQFRSLLAQDHSEAIGERRRLKFQKLREAGGQTSIV